jgi:KUP system potassium uptake protein
MSKPLAAKLEPGAPEEPDSLSLHSLMGLSLTALGVVYGDIGTSPLYAVKTCFHGTFAIPAHPHNIFGVLSLIFWSLIIVISLKYLVYVLRADNRGEGGILALMALIHPRYKVTGLGRWLLIALGLFGAALLYGDGTITPAISVLSSIEGLEVATDFFKPYIVPLTIIILVLLFSFQRQGTGTVGFIFGPIMLVWFVTIGVLGISGIVRQPEVLAAIHPAHALSFFVANGWQGFLILGLIFLVVTGGEALYADMGHVGKTPIRIAWFGLVLPALLLNYFGQGALLLSDPSLTRNPFYLLAPAWALYPLVALATVATVIASQAVISGAFSLTRQAIQLGFCPRLKIDHTSEEEIGQVYMGSVNWCLMIATISLVVGFEKSTNLAAAYGVAVSTTMVITTILIGVVAREIWDWPVIAVAAVSTLFLIPDCSFFVANLTKIAEGGWFPLVIAALVFTLMSTWQAGMAYLDDILQETRVPVEKYLESFHLEPPPRVEGTAVFLTGNTQGVPQALLYQLEHNKALHQKVVFLTIVTENTPRVVRMDQIEMEDLGQNFYRVIAHHGFTEYLTMARVFSRLKPTGLDLNLEEASFFLSRINIIPVRGHRMNFGLAKVFDIMARNAAPLTTFFKIPPHRAIELGSFVEL